MIAPHLLIITDIGDEVGCRGIDVDGQAVAAEKFSKPHRRAFFRKAHRLGDAGQHRHAGSNTFTVRITAKAVAAFDGMADGVSEV